MTAAIGFVFIISGSAFIGTSGRSTAVVGEATGSGTALVDKGEPERTAVDSCLRLQAAAAGRRCLATGDLPTTCGPEGKAVGDGVCIDKAPVFIVVIERCRSARRAVSYYRAKTWATQADFRRRADRTPIVRGKSCRWARHAAHEWQGRSRNATARWHDQFAWRDWLPSNWVQVGTCETHMDFGHHNRKFVSMFGISRREYNADAAVFGGPPWDDDHPPTPRQQYDAARGHYARFGDGWTCPGP